MPTNYFWEVSPSSDFTNLLSWRQLAKRRFSAMRARILMAQSESGFDYHGPAIEKLNIGPTKREFTYKREQIFTWQVKSDKDPGVTILKLSQSGDSVSGTWQPAHGDPSEIENGKIVGEILTFSFTRNTHPINATGHLSGDTISFDITGHKWGMSKTVHRTATRIALN